MPDKSPVENPATDDEEIIDLLEVVSLGKSAPQSSEESDSVDFSQHIDSMMEELAKHEGADAEAEDQPFPDPTPVDHEVDPNEELPMPSMEDLDNLLESLGAAPEDEHATETTEAVSQGDDLDLKPHEGASAKVSEEVETPAQTEILEDTPLEPAPIEAEMPAPADVETPAEIPAEPETQNNAVTDPAQEIPLDTQGLDFGGSSSPAEPTPVEVEAPAPAEPAPVEVEAPAPAESTPVEVEAPAPAPAESTPVEVEAPAPAPAEPTPVEVEAPAPAPAESTPVEVEAPAPAPEESTPTEVEAPAPAPAEPTPVEVEAPRKEQEMSISGSAIAEVDLNELDALIDDVLAVAPPSGGNTKKEATQEAPLEAPALNVESSPACTGEAPNTLEDLQHAVTQLQAIVNDQANHIQNLQVMLDENLDKKVAAAAAKVIREEILALLQPDE